MDISFNNNFQENFMFYQRNIRDYGDNVHEYNQNMSNYLTWMSYQTTNNAIRRSARQSNRNTFNSVFQNYLHRYEHDRTPFIWNRASYEPVVVRPNSAQIANATEFIEYTNEFTHNACPITLEAFQEGEQVCRIIHCGHIFKESGIREWFQRNVRCPVCRYDIRDYIRPTVGEDDENSSNDHEETEFDDVIRELNQELNTELNRTQPTQPTQSTARTDSSTNPITNLLTNAVRSFINNELQHIPANSSFNELIYTFDIPIDLSGGTYRI